MTKEELIKWFDLLQLVTKSGYKLDKNDYSELLRLNHLVMEASHEIHNKNMLDN
jgi:hypothetical protein